MNRNQLAAAVAERTGGSATEAEAALAAVTEAIAAAVAGGDRVTLPGFGTFEARERSARSGRNPQTGAAIDIPATRGPAFKPATAFKTRVSEAKAR